ncbi:MAG: hypothetical protein K2L04_02800 [Alistipes sp.]|nr:hypothetical protein [Alistipes sp.]
MLNILQRLSLAVEKINVKSIINAPGKYMLYTLLFGIFTAVFNLPAWISIVLFSFAGIFLIIVVIMFYYFARTNPDYLRSEEYNLKKHSIEILGDKDNYLPVDMSTIVDVVNSYQEPIAIEGKEDTND